MPEGSPEARGGGARPSGPGRAGDGLVALALALPAALPYVAHVLRAAQGALLPTGFLVYDMAFYMANAREHFDGGGFRLLYGLPFSPAYTTPAIYFQPHTLLLGAVWRATGLDVPRHRLHPASLLVRPPHRDTRLGGTSRGAAAVLRDGRGSRRLAGPPPARRAGARGPRGAAALLGGRAERRTGLRERGVRGVPPRAGPVACVGSRAVAAPVRQRPA